MISRYDQAGDFYFDFVQNGLSDPNSIFYLSANAVLALIGDLDGKIVCDIACGEGNLSRKLAAQGAVVTAVDISENLLAHARQQAGALSITTIRDDAQILKQLPSQFAQIAICNLALMDIPDFAAVFAAVHRVLATNGIFVFSVLHPCFETPYRVPESHIQLDQQGNFEAVLVRRYAAEGYWNSGGTGMRGTFGAYHRTLSTYLNSLMKAGFQIKQLLEPRLPIGHYIHLGHQINSRVGQLLVVSAQKVAS